MNSFETLTKKCQEEQVAQLIDMLNTHRLQLTKTFSASHNMPKHKVEQILLSLQTNLYQKEFTFNLKTLNIENLNNLMKFFSSSQPELQPQKKYNVNWSAVNDKNQGKDGLKNQHNRWGEKKERQKKEKKQQVFCVQQNHPKGTVQNNNKSFNLGNQKLPLLSGVDKKVRSCKGVKSDEVQFISASNLPKTSIRKKFIPPFKKNQSQIYKQEIKEQKDQDEKCTNPKYKGLEQKLVETIESEILETKSSIGWNQIAGLSFAKKLINQMIVWPMLRPDIFTGLRAPPRGILLFGPPGTGKTMIGRAIASSASATFFNISASSLTSKWVGESQKLVRTLFQIARVKQPSVIFIDEIDSLLCARSQGQQQSSRRVKTEFLVQLDGTKTTQSERILIIGATNLPQQLDDAVRRRFTKRLYIPLPNKQSRFQLIESLTKDFTFHIGKQDRQKLAQLTKGYSGADIHSLCKQASIIPLRQISSIEKIRQSQVPKAQVRHFVEALKFVRASVNMKALAKYEEWNQQFGSYQFNPDELEN